MKTIIAVTLATLISTPALAWGDREQGALAGAAGVILLQQLNNQPRQPEYVPPQRYYSPPPVQYYEQPTREIHMYPRQRICHNRTLIDHRGQSIGYERICR